MLYHEFVTNKAVRSGAERICVLYGRDEQECKANIDSALDMSDEEVQNNIQINWVMWPRGEYGTIRLVKKESHD